MWRNNAKNIYKWLSNSKIADLELCLYFNPIDHATGSLSVPVSKLHGSWVEQNQNVLISLLNKYNYCAPTTPGKCKL